MREKRNDFILFLTRILHNISINNADYIGRKSVNLFKIMQSLSSKKCWGLFQKENDSPIPLKSLDITVNIIHNIARVTYTQEYYNDFNVLLQSEFYFPISSEACFDSFEAKFGDTVMKGVVKEKEEARQQYQEEYKKGSTIAYSEINEETGDVMKVLMGNIPPLGTMSVTYSYIEKLDIKINQFWCFRLFSSLTPRYKGSLKEYLSRDISILASYPTLSSKDSNAYPWNVKVDIQSPYPITSVESPSHKIVTNYGNENHTCNIIFSSEETHYPNKDFVLLYSNKSSNNLDYLMTPFEDDYCAMVTFRANFSNKELSTNEGMAKEDMISLNSAKGEFIFLIDQSGSMKGERIEMAKNSLMLFLKSLPLDSYFNIISFGSQHRPLFNHSVRNSQDSVSKAIFEIEGFDANMGGTEILKPLNYVLKTPLRKEYPRLIFLLTDGAVSNIKDILHLIENYNKEARVFTIGIGNGCSTELITKGALIGRGKHEFVANNVEIYEKVIDLLDKSLTINNAKLSFQSENFDAVVKGISPNPNFVSDLVKGELITFFIFIRSYAFENNQRMTLKLRIYDNKTNTYYTEEITLDAQKAIENDLLPKLAIHDMMKRLETSLDSEEKDILWSDKAEMRSTLLEYSLQYEILCKQTAFLCEITENYGPNKSLKQTNVIVPTILSKDYLRDQPLFTKFTSKSGKHGRAKTFYLPVREDEEGTTRSPEFEEAVANKVPRKISPFLPVVVKQNFEGSWDCNDEILKNLILSKKDYMPIPAELKLSGDDTKTIWITVLVLLWLEVVCGAESASWKLVHKKGLEWLQLQGIKYEEIKELGRPFINTKSL